VDAVLMVFAALAVLELAKQLKNWHRKYLVSDKVQV
jgi:hypothetical protein